MGVEMVLHPKLLALSVDPHKRMRPVTVHVPPRARQSALAHQIGDLVGGFGVVGTEVSLHVVVAQTCIGEELLTADNVRKVHRFANGGSEIVVASTVNVD